MPALTLAGLAFAALALALAGLAFAGLGLSALAAFLVPLPLSALADAAGLVSRDAVVDLPVGRRARLRRRSPAPRESAGRASPSPRRAPLWVPDLVAAGFAGVAFGAAARAAAASFSDVTADSRARVAVEIEPKAVVSVLADAAARVAASFSLVAAVDTRDAAAATVLGVTVRADVPLAALRAVVVRVLALAGFAELAALEVPVVRDVFAVPVLAAGFALLVGFAAPAGLVPLPGFPLPLVFAVPAAALARPGLALRTGAALAAVVFVGGTELPPI